MTMFESLLVGVLLLLPVMCIANASERSACISGAEAAIHGYVPGQDKERTAKGAKPVETSSYTGEDDGGWYTATVMKYKSYEIHVVRGMIDSVRTDSAGFKWAAGVRMGMDKATIDRKIGYARVWEAADEVQYLVCSSVGDVYATLYFAKDRLTGIDVSLDRP